MTLAQQTKAGKNDVYWLEHKGKKIIFHDFSHVSAVQGLELMKKGRSIVRTQPENSLLELVDVTGADFDIRTAEGIKEYAAGNKPYSKRCAIVGVDGLKKVIFQAVVSFSGRDFKLFDNAEEAKDWLVSDDNI